MPVCAHVFAEGVLAMSPSRRYAAVETSDPVVKGPAGNLMRLIDLDEKRVLAEVNAYSSTRPVDDRGLVAWEKTEGFDSTVNVTSARSSLVLGPGRPLLWDARGRLVIADTRILAGNIASRIPGDLRAKYPPSRKRCGLVTARTLRADEKTILLGK